jgi:hypothetical protein
VNASTGVVTGVAAGTSVINYSVTTTGGCVNTACEHTVVSTTIVSAAASSTPTLYQYRFNSYYTYNYWCRYRTATGLPSGVTAVSNTITISGTPTAAGTFSYSIPLTGWLWNG